MNKQRGTTLLGLLIGMLISSIAVSGMLLVYRNTILVISRVTPAATEDSQRISALLRAHLLIQKAGFGIDNPSLATDLIDLDNLTWVVNGDSGSLQTDYQDNGDGNGGGNGGEEGGGAGGGINVSGESVIWSSDADLDGNVVCEGIVPTNEGGLKWLTGSCANAAAWNAVSNWTSVDLIAASAPANTELSLSVNVDDSATCSPVGSGGGATDMLRGIPARFSVTLSTGAAVSSTTCLYNFDSASP